MPPTNPQLLIVNSNPEIRSQLQACLTDTCLSLATVDSGLAAIKFLRNKAVDLIITDINIGEFDGWRLTRLIRSGIYKTESTVPIIIVTDSWCERITEITAREFGINYLLPFEKHLQLPELVQTCLNDPDAGLSRPRVLVVEDHLENADLVKRMLRYRFEIEIANDGQAGLDAWKRGRHDLVLLDVMLPKMSGPDVLDKILQESPGQPVVIMTAFSTIDLAESLMLNGAVDFIIKPFRAEQLRQVCELATCREDYLISNTQFGNRLDSIQKLQNLLGSIINSMPSILIGVDQNLNVTQWNAEAEKVTGILTIDALGNDIQNLYPHFPMDLIRIEQAMQNRSPVKNSRVSWLLNDKTIYADITIYPLLNSIENGAVILIDDVTNRVRLEEIMVQSEKMISIGGLAAGMAHEINNPLAGILQNIQVIRNRTSEDTAKNQTVAQKCGTDMAAIVSYLEQREIFSRLESIMDSGRQAARIVENMLSFSYKGNTSITPSNVDELLDKALEMAATSFDLKKKFDFRSVEIQREYDSTLPQVPCDSGQIQQVFLNLLLNGAHAMEEKASQLKKSGQSTFTAPRFILRLKTAKNKLIAEIEDNGIGIDDNLRHRIFEPFFTTKEVGVGTGLGLSVSYFIVTENHNGTMVVDSTPGKQTTFTMELPLTS